MKYSPETKVTHRTADYVVRTEHIEGQETVRFIDVQGRYPEAGSEIAEYDLRITCLEGDGKLIIGGTYIALAARAVATVREKYNFHLEGSPMTVAVAPNTESTT